MKEGGSSKFWEVEVRGVELIVQFGRLGTDGQRKAKRLANAAAAQKEADKLVREKLAKGYVERGAEAKVKPKPASKAKKPKLAEASVAELWDYIEAWCAKHKPGLSLQLRPGATEKQIVAAEKALGRKLPADFRASVKIHDGQEDGCTVGWVPVALQLRSLASIVRCWTGDRVYYRESAEAFDALDKTKCVRQCHLHPAHLPFAALMHWDYGRLMFDFTPGPKGTAGQVIARNDIDLVFMAPTFRDLLADIAGDLPRLVEDLA